MSRSPRPIGSASNHRPASTVFDRANPIFTSDDDPIRTALNRATDSVLSSTAPALRAACNVVQPGATPRNPMQPIREMRKTNPITPPAGCAASVASAIAQTPRPPLGRDAEGTNIAPPPCNPTQPGATSRDAMQPDQAACKTNPILSNDACDARQLAAARLLATGRSTLEVARELNVCRSTVWRWQRDPSFRAELRRFHERMITAEARRR